MNSQFFQVTFTRDFDEQDGWPNRLGSCFLMFLAGIAPCIMEVWNIFKMPRLGRRAQGRAWLSIVSVFVPTVRTISYFVGDALEFNWLKRTFLEVAIWQLGTAVKSKSVGAWPQSLGNPRFPCCPCSMSSSAAWGLEL